MTRAWPWMAAKLMLAGAALIASSPRANADPSDEPDASANPAAARSGAKDDPWAEVELQVPSPEDKPLARPVVADSEQVIAHTTSPAVASTSWVRSTASLAGVVALIVLLAWGYRTFAGGGRLALAGRARRPGLIEVISRTSLSARQSLCLVRVGPRLVLVGVSGDRLSALDVIDDADLTARLAGEQLSRNQSVGGAFGKLLQTERGSYEPEAGLDETAVAPDAGRLSDVRDQLTRTIQRIRRASSTARGTLNESTEAPAARVAT